MKMVIRTAADLAAAAEATERRRAGDAARRYLAETDWLVIRTAETRRPLPDEVAARRAEARRIAGAT